MYIYRDNTWQWFTILSVGVRVLVLVLGVPFNSSTMNNLDFTCEKDYEHRYGT